MKSLKERKSDEKAKQLGLGYSEQEATARGNSIAFGNLNAETLASVNELKPGDFVALDGGREGYVTPEGRLSVGGCIPVYGAGDPVSLPYKLKGGDWVNVGEARAVLADGTEVLQAESGYTAKSQSFRTVAEAAAALTPKPRR